ncbi:glucokinase [Thermosipho melanesiensis]|uniref:ROK family protein n=2 Tax=Thermosipho melanesiensis TaxID=46541 RepID=A6LM45_THEM4|nr:ROK family protein [Thermosipho melanesiensis]ABR30996.1 ROK family protein [Thermosipho melanesiensis BI429]APT74093.1 glucokinase [Thermosipho melanesiensis]OOC36039.1 glucokinase [Thermosipho melanesiensis]OOC36856.1 glucokinase [Thermosipho melanesiensis]OOC37607.1 glucokinase [Thermosipho melanesiensis]
MKIVGVDLGGTFVKIGLVNEKSGKILKKTTIETKVELGGKTVVKRIAEAITNLTNNDFYAVGIGSPGSIDKERGIVRFSPNFPDWHNFELAPKLSKLLNKNVYVENDANSFVLGEKWFGAGKGKKHIVALTLGTGVGGGVISHNILITGKDGIGAELGHVIINPNGPLCGCGNYGCLEAYASATAIVRMAKERRKKFPDSVIFKDEITAKNIFEAVKLNDRLAVIIRNEVVEALSIGITSFIHIFNPEVVIIGGGVSRAGEILFEPLRRRVEELVMPTFKGTYKIVQSPLVENAGILGAASIVLQREN